MSDRDPLPPLVVLTGPTATGKSAAAIALAQRFDGAIISADSRQIYRGMDIGTAKPTLSERAAAPHFLIDIRNPDEDFSLADYLTLARATAGAIHTRGQLPLLVGGTPLYINAFAEGWRLPAVPPAPALRARLEAEVAQSGLATLSARLATVDPVTAARAAGNARRIIRALEVYELTGLPLSMQEGREPPPYHILQIVLSLDRRVLYARIDARVDRMIADGLVDEVRRLLDQGYDPNLPAMSGIGYAEIIAYLAGKATLVDAVARIKYNTHRYVRHQETWFRRARPTTARFRADVVNVAEADWLDRLQARVSEFLTNDLVARDV